MFHLFCLCSTCPHSFLVHWQTVVCSCFRRIDVSPSAFKRHSQLFEEMEEPGYKVTCPFENWRCLEQAKIMTIQSSSYSALCFSFKGCIFLNQKSPNVCFVSAKPVPAYEIWLLIGYKRTQAKAKRKWIKMNPSFSKDAYHCLYLVSIFSKRPKIKPLKRVCSKCFMHAAVSMKCSVLSKV